MMSNVALELMSLELIIAQLLYLQFDDPGEAHLLYQLHRNPPGTTARPLVMRPKPSPYLRHHAVHQTAHPQLLLPSVSYGDGGDDPVIRCQLIMSLPHATITLRAADRGIGKLQGQVGI
jgi:hypothetical protein